MTDIIAELVDLSDLGTPLATLDDTEDRQFSEVLCDTGSGKVTFQNDDPDLALLVPPNALVNFYVDTTPAFTMLCEHVEATLVDQAEEKAEVTIWSGRGHSALFDGVALYPSNGINAQPVQEDRAFNWTDYAYDDSAWPAATYVTSLSTGNVFVWPFLTDIPVSVGDPDVLWASDGTTTGVAGPGTWDPCDFRQHITVPRDGPYLLMIGADNAGTVYCDGNLVTTIDGSNAGSGRAIRATIDLTAGDHVIAVTAFNFGGFFGVPDQAGIWWSLLTFNWIVPTCIARSDASLCKITEYAASPPGMTPGAALLLIIAEAQARGAIGYITTSFDATNDTAGNPWPVVADISTKVGTSLLTFLKELSGTYIDWYMAPKTLVLDAWIMGGRTTTPGVDFHSPTDPTDPLSGNLTGHKETGEA